MTRVCKGSEFVCRHCGSPSCVEVTHGIRDWEYGTAGEFSYVECSSCELVQLHPFPSIEQLIEAYKIDYHGYVSPDDKGFLYSLLFRVHGYLLRRRVKNILPSEAAVLDVGCGNGVFLQSLKVFGPARLDGIDFSEKSVELGRRRGLNVFQGVFSDFPAEFQSYDAVFMNNYLEHTINPAKELKKAFNLLKPDGSILGEVPNFQSLDRIIFGRYWGGNHVPRHTYQFTPGTLETLLSEVGFENIKITQELNPGHLTLSVQNYFQRNVVDLQNNPAITRGRTWYFTPLSLFTTPVNLIFKLIGLSGVMTFAATRV